MAILFPRNDALTVNPPAGNQYLTTNGSNWLFTVATIFGLSTLVLYALNFKPRGGERFFHYLFIIANFVGLIAYYAMASDLAWSPVRQANQVRRSGPIRQIFWAKYVFWVVVFPIIITTLGIISGISWATIIYNVALSWVWIIAYLVAAYTATNYKWGFFAFGTVALLFLMLSMFLHGLRSANRVGIKTDYLALSSWLTLLWVLYPISWALSDGGNYIGVTPSFIWFGILDVMLLTGIGFAVVVMSRRWDYGRLNIAFTQYGRVPAQAGTFPEKQAATSVPAATPATGTEQAVV
jgi:bacteriorhodopsin